jgi:hypothetical protein
MQWDMNIGMRGCDTGGGRKEVTEAEAEVAKQIFRTPKASLQTRRLLLYMRDSVRKIRVYVFVRGVHILEIYSK